MASLRFGVDGEALRAPLSGVGHYCFNLCQALEKQLPQVEFFAYGRLPRHQLKLPSERWILRQERVPSMRRIPSYVWLKTRARALCLEDKLDFFWGARTIHPRLPSPTCTISTVHDLNHILVPETMQPVSRLMHNLWFAEDVKHADYVLTNSMGTATRVSELLGTPVKDVVRPGLHPRFRPLDGAEREAAAERLAEFGIRRPYLLSVGTVEPRKNLKALSKTFVRLKRAGILPEHQLVLVGGSGWNNKGLMRELRAASEFGVVMPGYLPDDFLPGAYALADALVFPSLYEGFGMPVLEARGCGTQTIISDIPELLEAGGPGAIVVQPTEESLAGGILAAIRKAAEVGQVEQPPAGVLAQDFSWRQSASRLAALVR